MILDAIAEFFWSIIISLVGAIYQLVNYTYQVFLFLAKTNIFDESTYHNLTDKIYVILGVVMLFVIAYNLLTLVVDPDKNDKGQTIEKLLKNIVTSFILIIVCPSIFNFAFKVSDSVLTTNGGIINNFFSDSLDDVGGDDTIKAGGKMMAINTFRAFFVPTKEGNYSLISQTANSKYTLTNGTVIDCSGSCTLSQAEQAAKNLGTFSPFKAFSKNIVKDEVEFNWLIALIAGGYLVYVIVSFCFDLAVRACRLAFYQIIAPIAITCRILPNQEDIFNKWMKATWKTYLSVFIRVIIMNLGVYLISVFINSNFFSKCDSCSFGVTLIGYAFIILGIITFVKEAPKLVDEIFGLGDGISLGIREKLKGGGAFVAGSAIGAGATSLVHNASGAITNFRDAKGFKNKAIALGKGIGSTVAGGASGAVRGFQNGQKASNFTEMAQQTESAANAAAAARDDRTARVLRYKATGKNPFTRNFIGGHIMDMGANIKNWATGGVAQYEGDIKVGEKFTKAQDTMHAAAEKIMNKYRDNIDIVPTLVEDDFKGNNKAALYQLYNDMFIKGEMDLKNMEGELASRKAFTDWKSLVDDRSTFASQDEYNAAIETARRNYVQKTQNMDTMINQLTKLVKFRIEDAAAGGTTLNGIKAEDLIDVKSGYDELVDLYTASGSYAKNNTIKRENYPDGAAGEQAYKDALKDAIKEGSVPKGTGKTGGAKFLDDVVTIHNKNAAQAKSDSARLRREAEERKGNSSNK